MHILSSALFWGGVLVLLGASVILKALFHIDLPVFRLLLGVILIYVGFKVVCGKSCWSSSCNTTPASTVTADKGVSPEYSVVFGQQVLDFRNMSVGDSNKVTRVNVVFGQAVIKLDPDTPVEVIGQSAFASIKTPAGPSPALGQSRHETKGFKAEKPHLTIQANVVFGEIQVEEEAKNDKKAN